MAVPPAGPASPGLEGWELPAGDSPGQGEGTSTLHPVLQPCGSRPDSAGEKSPPSVPATVFRAALLLQHHLSPVPSPKSQAGPLPSRDKLLDSIRALLGREIFRMKHSRSCRARAQRCPGSNTNIPALLPAFQKPSGIGVIVGGWGSFTGSGCV